MATGTLGESELTENTEVTVYTVPNGKTSTINIAVCNRNSIAITISLGITTGVSLINKNYVEYNVSIPPYGILERSGIVIGQTEKVIARSNSNDVNVRIYGYEESL